MLIESAVSRNKSIGMTTKKPSGESVEKEMKCV